MISIFLTSAIAIFLDIPPASVGTQVVVAVIVGLLIAFAVQFLLTNLGLALGISLLKYRPPASSELAESSQSKDISVDLGLVAGLGILVTLNLVLFIACFLAVRFSTASDPISGATLGIIIWSTYFLILIWASYSAVGSVTAWIFGSIATKLRQLIEAIASSFQSEPASELLTEEAAANLIHGEIQTALGELDLEQQIDDYLQTVPSPKLDLSSIAQEFTDLLAKSNLDLEGTDLLQQVDRQTFVTLIDRHTNLATSEANRVADLLERVWQQAVRDEKRDLNGTLLQFLQSADAEELQLEQLVQRLERIVGEESDDNLDSEQRSPQTDEVHSDRNSIIKSWSNLDWKAIKHALLERVDFSEVELEDVWHNLQSLYQQTEGEGTRYQLSFNTINHDVEDYLWHAPPWYLNCERGWQEFKEVIYDPQADPAQVRFQLEQIRLPDLVEILQQRDLDAAQIDRIVEHLEAVRQEVFCLIDRAELSEQKQELSELVRDYLQQAELSELRDNLTLKLEQLLIESGFNTRVLAQFLPSWQQLDWHTWLQQRQDLAPNDSKQIAEQLASAGDPLLAKVEAWQVQITSTAKELQHKLDSYLRYTNLDHLTPNKIDAKLEQLWQEAVDRLPQIQQQLPEINYSTLVEILEKRRGIDSKQIEAIATQIETNWHRANDFIAPKISPLQTKSTELTENLVDYLSQAIEQNLDRAAIEPDLIPLLNMVRGKTKSLAKRQLAGVDWKEIEAKLKQVRQGSESKIRQTIKQTREATYKLIKLPRRWATRTSRTRDLVDIEDFLSHSDKIEFTSQHLKRNLSSILHSSTQSSNSNSTTDPLDRLAKLTSANITQFLSHRQDLTPVEIEQISDRFKAITAQLSEEVQNQQEQTNKRFRDLQDRLGEYFDSLNFFDYSRLKDSLANFDFQAVTDSWQETIAETPLEELGDRLGQLSQDLSTIIEANELISDSTSQHIQGIQNYLAQQIDTVKQTAYEQTETIKQRTLQQAEATRKAIATAAYWMFAITFTSAMASIVAGFLATTHHYSN